MITLLRHTKQILRSIVRDTNAGKVQLTKDARAARDYFNQVKEDYAMPMQGRRFWNV